MNKLKINYRRKFRGKEDHCTKLHVNLKQNETLNRIRVEGTKIISHKNSVNKLYNINGCCELT